MNLWLRTLLLAYLLLLPATAAHSAEVKALVAEAFRSAMVPIIADFEMQSGHKVTAVFGTAGALREKLKAGEHADVVLLPQGSFQSLLAERAIASGTEVPVALSLMSLVVRAGAQKPDISSVGMLKQSLLAARGIAYPDPARGGAVGAHAVWVIDKLGIADEVKSKTFKAAGSELGALLAKGDVDLALYIPSVAVDDARVEVVGPLPGELQSKANFLYIVGLTPQASDPAAARALVQYLVSLPAAAVIKTKGMEPQAK
jgi:molybdate transport system substrate-binding protein